MYRANALVSLLLSGLSTALSATAAAAAAAAAHAVELVVVALALSHLDVLLAKAIGEV